MCIVITLNLSYCKNIDSGDITEQLVSSITNKEIIALTPNSVASYFNFLTPSVKVDSGGQFLTIVNTDSSSRIFKSLKAEFRKDSNQSQRETLFSLEIILSFDSAEQYKSFRNRIRDHFGIDGHPIGFKNGTGEEWYIEKFYYLLLSHTNQKPEEVSIKIHINEGYD